MPNKTSSRKKFFTVSEKSNYKRTATYDDVVQFMTDLHAETDCFTLHKFGETTEGRDLLMAVFSRTPIYDASQALKSEKPVVLLQNNIHAGEVCPKEAAMMLMRDIAFGNLNHLLDELIILIVPIYNADGNERFSNLHRLTQIGPDEGVGIRTNAVGLDLNRDYMKMEAVETKALIGNLYTKWFPDVIVDGHTTDGSRHGYDLTYGFPQNPNANDALISFTRDQLLPEVSAAIKKQTGIDMFFYADFKNHTKPEEGWVTYSHHPRYGASYGGLQNRIAILMETYSYVSFKRRVVAAYHFMREVLEYAARNAETVKSIVRLAEAETIEKGLSYHAEKNRIGLEFDKQAFDEKVTVIGYEVKEKKNSDGSITYLPTTKKKLYKAPYYANFVTVRSTPRPMAYLLPRAETRVIEKLKGHGIAVEKLLKPFKTAVEAFEVLSVSHNPEVNNGHREVKVSVKLRKLTLTFGFGDFVVPMSQPAGNVAAYLLEPETDDGLVNWNYFDNYLTGKLRMEKDFYTEYEYNLIDLPHTKKIYEKLIDKNPSIPTSQKAQKKMEFFTEALGYRNELMNTIPVFRLTTKQPYAAILV
jgi:hypothetical protein